MTRTWEDNALEFGALTKQGRDARLALLVACSVEKGKGQSERGSRHNNRYDEKVSAQAFAEAAGTSAPRVLRHLDAWDRIAAAGHLGPSKSSAVSHEPPHRPRGGRPRLPRRAAGRSRMAGLSDQAVALTKFLDAVKMS
jgi:hypothetical protein